MNEPEGMITVQEAARRLNRSIEQVRRYLREGKLKGRRIGQQWFIDEASLAGRPFRYPAPKPGALRIAEPAAVLERTTMDRKTTTLMREIDAGREAIRRRLGRDLTADAVEMVRVDREEHLPVTFCVDTSAVIPLLL